MDKKFKADRDRALDEIQKAVSTRVTELAKWSQTLTGNNKQLLLPEYVELLETFTWPTAVSSAAGDLKQGKSLKEIFARVSSRYQAKDPRQVLGLAEDTDRSPAAKLDGRAAAFEDILKVLTVAERDFDITYKPLSAETLKYWSKVHPIGDQNLEFAWKENQRMFMKQSIGELRELVEALRDGKPAPAARPTPPKP